MMLYAWSFLCVILAKDLGQVFLGTFYQVNSNREYEEVTDLAYNTAAQGKKEKITMKNLI